MSKKPTESQSKPPPALQSNLDDEQAAVDLDQGIADREQARADRAQRPLDAAQEALSVALAGQTGSDENMHELDTSQLLLAQDRANAHQAQLDDTQRAHGVRQDLLDQQQAELEDDSLVGLGDVEAKRAQAVQELEDALHRRAEEALARADEARERAEKTLLRLQAAKARENGRK